MGIFSRKRREDESSNDYRGSHARDVDGIVSEHPWRVVAPMYRWIDTTPVESRDKPCTIASLDLQAHVCGLCARVEQTLVIANPNRRDISASLVIPLPDRAVVCGYALEIEGHMVDGVVVPKEQARVVFETEQRRGADPGLVESVKGNVYRTRVYPVPARGQRAVRLTYVAPLLVGDGSNAALDLPMPAEPVGRRSLRIDVEMLDCPAPTLSGLGDLRFEQTSALWSVESQEFDVAASDGVHVAMPQLPDSFVLLERDSGGTVWFSASEAVPEAPEAEDVPAITSLTVVWDGSGSRSGIDLKPEIELVRTFCEAPTVKAWRLVIFGAGAGVHQYDNPDDLIERLVTLHYDSATDFATLSRTLEPLYQSEPSTTPEECDACVLFTDGLDTLSDGPLEFPEGCNVLAIVSGPERDAESLRQACAGRVYDIAAAPKSIEELSRALFAAPRLTGVEGSGVADVIGVGSGADGRFTVVGRLAGPSVTIGFANTGTTFDLDLSQASEGSILSRAWAAMRVAQLSPRANDNADELLRLGRRYGVASPATSLLVLEDLEQWLRYDIKPPASLKEMRWEWMRQHAGRMQVTTQQQQEDAHLLMLAFEWRRLMDWWDGKTVLAEVVRRTSADHVMHMPESQGNAAYGQAPSPDSAPMPSMAYESRSASADSPMYYEAMEAPPMGSMPDSAVSASSDDWGGQADELSASVRVEPWSPDAAYLEELDKAQLSDVHYAARLAYFDLRLQHANSPSFFVDCAGWFIAHDDLDFGVRVLSNLAELRIEDAALLRVMAWRLREAGELERSLVVLRRVLRMRGEDSQSYRDIALVLDELARKAYVQGDEEGAREYAQQAGEMYRKIATTPWQRRAMALGLFAVEEYNVLRAWVQEQQWSDGAPELPSLGPGLEGVPSCDLRITLAWDADETDVDIHVTEPSGEEAYYANRFTYAGGRVSEDITDGYGPELYQIRHARQGVYDVRAHYYASHQQTVFGPATCTLTIYTDWGRPGQTQQVTSIRLNQENTMHRVGTVTYGGAGQSSDVDDDAGERAGQELSIAKGSTPAQVLEAFGQPDEGDPRQPKGAWGWQLTGGRMRVVVFANGVVERVVEVLPGGIEMVLLQ